STSAGRYRSPNECAVSSPTKLFPQTNSSFPLQFLLAAPRLTRFVMIDRKRCCSKLTNDCTPPKLPVEIRSVQPLNFSAVDHFLLIMCLRAIRRLFISSAADYAPRVSGLARG